MQKNCCFRDGIDRFRYRAAAIIIEDGYVLFATNETADYLYSVGGGVYLGERAENAVKREVLEETGVEYEIDRLAVVHENFYTEFMDGVDTNCHEIAFYYLMKPRGNKNVNASGYTQGVKENMVWISLDKIDEYKAYPSFLSDYLKSPKQGITHIVTDERIK